MIYYMIRHKATGEFMPELKRGRGYSHWNPSADYLQTISSSKYTGAPRLLPTIRMAKQCIAMWNCVPNGYRSYKQGYFGDDGDAFTDIKPDGRKKEDLEIVIVNIEETGTIK